jgi:hypothetical protein
MAIAMIQEINIFIVLKFVVGTKNHSAIERMQELRNGTNNIGGAPAISDVRRGDRKDVI